MTLLTSTNITLQRSPRLTLRFADITVNPAENTLLLGPSGCGKTTLLSILAGLLKPTTGNVHFNGEDFYALSPAKRDKLRGSSFGFVFQTLHLLPSLTLRQNVALAADMAGLEADSRRIDGLLGGLGLAEKAQRKPHALSQGEQQRAAIARAVLNRPKLILADEPTSALDDANAMIVVDLLKKQAAENGAALLIATHDNRIIPHFDNVIRLESRLKEAA